MAPDPIDAGRHRALSGASRVAVLEALRASPVALDVPTLAEAVGLHPNTVRSHLDQLVRVQLVGKDVQVRTSPGRPRVLFRASVDVGEQRQDAYRLLAQILADGIRDGEGSAGVVAMRAGRRWGQRVEAAATDGGANGPVVDRVVGLLAEIGFGPTVDGSDDVETVISLHRCPFIDVARANVDVVCAVHLGLLQGAIAEMDGPVPSVGLEPFVRPDLCVVRLGHAAATA